MSTSNHGLIIFKDTKTKCRLYWGLQIGDTVSHVGIFDAYCELLPSTFSVTSPTQLPPSQSQNTVYTDSVWLRGEVVGGGGVLSFFGDHILQEFNTLYLTRYRTYKIALPPQQNPRRGGGLRQINTCRKVPKQVFF